MRAHGHAVLVGAFQSSGGPEGSYARWRCRHSAAAPPIWPARPTLTPPAPHPAAQDSYTLDGLDPEVSTRWCTAGLCEGRGQEQQHRHALLHARQKCVKAGCKSTNTQALAAHTAGVQ
eukprot:364062-Chlamydomonas_euryale.AAC.11